MSAVKSDLDHKTEEKTVELPALDFFKINIISFVVPLYACLGLFALFIYFTQVFSIPFVVLIFTLPGYLMALYYLYLVLHIEFCAFWSRKWNKKSPPQQGVIPRILNPESPEGKMIKYYHKRGFIIKDPMWFASKSPFPWLLNRALRRIGHNKIGKNAMYCDGYAGLEFTDLADNVFIYPTTALSSHEVNSIHGKLSILEIKIGQNSVLHPGIIVGPNALVTNDNVIYPNTVLHKNWRGKPEKYYYQGSPGRPIEVKSLEVKKE